MREKSSANRPSFSAFSERPERVKAAEFLKNCQWARVVLV